MKKWRMVLVILLLLSACALPGEPRRDEISESPSKEGWRCPSLPETFTDASLVGMWQSRHGSWATDTIILRENGTYKQVYYSQPNDYYYESTWNRWWLEPRASGGLYLHLEAMRYCLSTDELCQEEGGGGGDWTYYDKCEGRSIPMNGQVILAVTGVEGIRFPPINSAPGGIVLWYLRSDPDTTDDFFLLQEQTA